MGRLLASLPILISACTSSPPEVITGRVCFVLDLRRPTDCLPAQQVGGIAVHDLDTGDRLTTADDGTFPLPDDLESGGHVLAFAEDRPDLRTSVVGVDASTRDLIVPVMTRALWQSYVDAVHLPPDDPTLAVVHIAFPLPGVLVGSATVGGAQAVYFNQGNAYVWADTPPGDQTVVFMGVGVPTTTGTTTVTIVQRDDQQFTLDVPVRPSDVTWVRFDPQAN